MDLTVLAVVVGWYAVAFYATRAADRVLPRSIWAVSPNVRLGLWLVSPLPPFCLLLMFVVWADAARETWAVVVPAWEWAAKKLFPDDDNRRAWR